MIHRAIVHLLMLLLLLVMLLLLLQMQLLWRCRNAVSAIRGSVLIKRTLSRSKRFIASAIDLLRLVASQLDRIGAQWACVVDTHVYKEAQRELLIKV